MTNLLDLTLPKNVSRATPKVCCPTPLDESVGSVLQPHAPEHVEEPRILAQKVESVIDFQKDQQSRSILECSFQSLQRASFITQTRIDAGNLDWSDVRMFPEFVQLGQDLLRLVGCPTARRRAQGHPGWQGYHQRDQAPFVSGEWLRGTFLAERKANRYASSPQRSSGPSRARFGTAQLIHRSDRPNTVCSPLPYE